MAKKLTQDETRTLQHNASLSWLSGIEYAEFVHAIANPSWTRDMQRVMINAFACCEISYQNGYAAGMAKLVIELKLRKGNK